MSRTFPMSHSDFNRRRLRAKLAAHPAAPVEVPLITEALAQRTAWEAYSRARRYGACAAEASAIYAEHYNRIVALVGQPVDVLFTEAQQ